MSMYNKLTHGIIRVKGPEGSMIKELLDKSVILTNNHDDTIRAWLDQTSSIPGISLGCSTSGLFYIGDTLFEHSLTNPVASHCECADGNSVILLKADITKDSYPIVSPTISTQDKVFSICRSEYCSGDTYTVDNVLAESYYEHLDNYKGMRCKIKKWKEMYKPFFEGNYSERLLSYYYASCLELNRYHDACMFDKDVPKIDVQKIKDQLSVVQDNRLNSPSLKAQLKADGSGRRDRR